MSLVNLSFIKYNNYFNKILKKPQNPYIMSQYEEYEEKLYLTDVAFNPNDGVTAYHVIPKDIDDIGDYLLVSNSADIILSHWFVIEAKRYRVGQCMVTLQRDLLVDYYNNIRTAPAFIERGMLSNDDPMIFNDEGLQYNQIKKSEELLYDKTGCGWIVGYLAKNAYSNDKTIEASITYSSGNPDIPEYDSWADVPEGLQNLVEGTSKYKRIDDTQLYLALKNIGYIRRNKTNCYSLTQLKAEYTNLYPFELDNCSFNSFNNLTGTLYPKKSLNLKQTTVESDGNTIVKTATVLSSSWLPYIETIKQELKFNNESLYDDVERYGNTKIKVGGTIYFLKKVITEEIFENTLNDLLPITKSLILNQIDNNLQYSDPFVDINGNVVSSLSNQTFYFIAKGTSIRIEAVEQGQTATLEIKANRQKTVDAQYDMFAIPYNKNKNSRFYKNSRLPQFARDVNFEASLAIAQSIAVDASDSLYDLQILPYCPESLLTKAWTSAGYVDAIIIRDGIDKSFIYDENDKEISYVLWCSHSSFNFQINKEIPLSEDAKSQKILEKYRLSGPNYASMFDFTPDMNGGVQYFNVYCDYRPYKPFIKINPEFSYLYGGEFKDPLGLILSGDFSLTIMKNAWQTYLLNNKNYEAMFDRGIQSIEKANNVAYLNSIFGAMAGTVGGAVAGGMAGSKAGPYGAVAGAVVGGTAAGVGGAIDVYNQDMLRTDSVNLQKAQFGYQLDNIKALPNTIQKITSLTQVNKFVPVLEYYTCTSNEREAFANFIKYNGMTVGRIDQIANFEEEGGFIQGRFLRLEGLSEDYHLANAINTTFQAGFYFDKEDE